jgi:hypothetical protein
MGCGMAPAVSKNGLSRVTGRSLLVGAVAFVAAASGLASTFGWLDILREPASVVLPGWCRGRHHPGSTSKVPFRQVVRGRPSTSSVSPGGEALSSIWAPTRRAAHEAPGLTVVCTEAQRGRSRPAPGLRRFPAREPGDGCSRPRQVHRTTCRGVLPPSPRPIGHVTTSITTRGDASSAHLLLPFIRPTKVRNAG